MFGWLFPNFTFNAYGTGISFLRIEPLGARCARLVYAYFRPADADPDVFEKETVDYAVQVSREDQAITPQVQRNLEAGVYRAGPLSPRQENGVLHFHDQVRAALEASPGAAAGGRMTEESDGGTPR